MSVRGWLRLGATVAVLAPAAATAQATDTLRLSLATALDIAEGNNPTYRRANNDLGLNGVQSRTLWFDRLLPQASLSLRTNFTGNIRRTAQDNFGNPIENPNAEWTYYSATAQQLQLNWQVQGQSLFQAHRRQGLTNEGRILTERRALSDLQAQVQRLYIDALEQRELMVMEQELVEARSIDLDVAQRLFSLAMRTRVDVLNAELAVEQQGLSLRQQQTAYDRALLALRTQLGRGDPEHIELGDETLPVFDPVGLDADELVHAALSVNPEVQQTRVTVRSSSLAVSESNNAWWPSLQLGISWSKAPQVRNSADALFDAALGNPIDSNFYAQFSIPMFNSFFQNRQSQEEAAIQLDNDREAERETRLRIEETVRGALLELGNQWETLRLVERQLDIAEEALELAREEYRIGTRTFEDLRTSFEQEADTRRLVITSRHAFVDALLSLEEAVGARVRPGSTPITSGAN